jgi:hypothetical protein
MMTFAGLNIPMLSRVALRGLIPLGGLTVLSLSFAVTMYVFVLSPAQGQVTNVEQRYQAAKQAHATLQGERTQQERARAAQRRLDEAWDSLPTQDEFASVAMAVAELAKRERIVIPGMNYDIKKPEGGLPVKATIAFRATGEYAAMYQFIHRLETADHYLIIEVARELKGSDAARVGVGIRVVTFLRHSDIPVKSS